MRDRTRTVLLAFFQGKPARVVNTETDGTEVRLYGNVIARRNKDGTLMLTMAGWETSTTRERLNAVLIFLNLSYEFRFRQRKGRQFFGNVEISSDDEVIIDESGKRVVDIVKA